MTPAPRVERLTVRLTTVGAKSGEPRPVTLYAFADGDFADGDALVVVGSLGGSARNPAWVHNLRANPVASLTVGKTTRRVRAREVGGQERQQLWALVAAGYPMYAAFQRRTKRVIPLFVLDAVVAEGARRR
ncbi:MAG TPA: nitroreductase/quinone reductase family protein [Candidatus Limnocylindria bacterium]|jgi:deazaflavin-dependent oxidoreductase (nitroreductase family)|nr:nitroreductase/quinone reductase family protein [Candidatus Limnocylindria bacterium]